MNPSLPTRRLILLLLPLLACSAGCASLVSGAASDFGNNLTTAILDQDDPELVRAGMPSYLLLLDSLLVNNRDNPAMLSAAGSLYASYGAVFADDATRASRLTRRAREYAQAAICLEYEPACGWREMTFEAFEASLAEVGPELSDRLFDYGFATLAYLQAHSADWSTLAELPQAEALLNHYLDISGEDADPSAYTYLGILLTLRPPALGGKPDEARAFFEQAIAATEGRDLSIKVEYAKGYARLLYERELHDRLLNEVLAASPYADGLTLTNVLAQEDAAELLASADDYF